jgi:signal transduction histidine kinase/CheY-like chemotaxis protein
MTAAPARHAAAFSLALLVCLLGRSSPLIDDGGLFLLLSITVLGSAWFAGTVSALGVTVLGAIFGAWLTRASPSTAIETHLALFILDGLLLTALVAELRRARRSAERGARLADAARLRGEAANRTKDEFLATISHELRTPLNAVLGWVHLIRSGRLDSATAGRGFEAIERNVRLQAQMTSDLLDISKALTGRLRIDSRPVSLNGAVREAAAYAWAAAAAKDVRLRITVPDTPIVVRGDANRLRQVVWHLLGNAIKFTPRGGAVDLTAESGDVAVITVRDTGPGIDAEFLPRMFGRFSQADVSPTRTTGGLGVGLALVRELVERHGGDIEARNAPEGRGAIFTVRLPVHAEDQVSHPVAPAAAVQTVNSPPLDGVRVLILDRDRDARELFSVVLEQRGALVRGTSSVDEALEMLESWRPDVLVSDAMSPDRDAYALIGKVHSLEAHRGGRIPALALTTLARTDERTRRLLSDVQRDLPKPVEPAVLTAEVARLAGRERRRAVR